jgi:acyl carrier protein
VDSLENKVLAAIADVTHKSPDEVSLESTFEELGIDSLNGFNLLVELEEDLGVTFPEDDARGLACVRDVVDALRLLLLQKQN